MAPHALRRCFSLAGGLLLALLAACATPTSLSAPRARDTLPQWLREGIAGGLPLEDPLQLSNGTRHRLELEASEAGGERTQMKKLLRFLIDNDGLAFQYRPTRTLNAEAAFHAREGDCMSYAMLYVAAARSLGIPVHFVRITQLPVFWEDRGRFFTSSHIAVEYGHDSWQEDAMVVDFSATHTSEWRVSLYDPIDDETAFVLFHTNRAVELLLRAEYSQAEQLLRFLLEHAPPQPEVYSNLGIVLLRLKRAQEATDLYAAAIQRFPRFGPLYTNAVAAAAASGHPDLVKAWSLAGRKVARSDPAFVFGEGLVAFREGDYTIAADRFSEALEIHPDDITLLAWTARAYLSAGNLRRGLRDVETIRSLAPSGAQRSLLNALREEFPEAGIVLVPTSGPGGPPSQAPPAALSRPRPPAPQQRRAQAQET